MDGGEGEDGVVPQKRGYKRGCGLRWMSGRGGRSRRLVHRSKCKKTMPVAYLPADVSDSMLRERIQR